MKPSCRPAVSADRPGYPCPVRRWLQEEALLCLSLSCGAPLPRCAHLVQAFPAMSRGGTTTCEETRKAARKVGRASNAGSKSVGTHRLCV
ncbi:hypothetical protein NDU88_002551 [Pleurodeles waltl]|uniref:Uncharacterized protein n=1 Tax=Pleurodeles waltl TaxID=8319 RepID=A0AAV7PAB6_PLEWA|nr:hypothetical protein NDU88_002551 [Pleurodeles waltl]